MIESGSIYIIPKLKDPFDFNEYLEACRVANIRPLALNLYGQKLGMFFVARRRYSDLAPDKAYLAFITEINQPAAPTQHKGGCGGGCGGGRKVK